MNQHNDDSFLILAIGMFLIVGAYKYYVSLTAADLALLLVLLGSVTSITGLIWFHFFSKHGRERRKRLEIIKELPDSLKTGSKDSVKMGLEKDLGIDIYLPDNIRARHVHILGATGSGKTESVILNFLKQDVRRGLGAIILDAKGDFSFLKELNRAVPSDKLQVFDLSSAESLGYNPLKSGSPLESAQRLFSSLLWSEEYYKSKALSALQGIYQYHYEIENKNPKLTDLAYYLEDAEKYSMARAKKDDKESSKAFMKEYSDVLGLRDQVNALCTGHLENILSPDDDQGINIEEAAHGKVLYFRLQSLMSPQLVGLVGRLLINNLNYLAGTAHRKALKANDAKLVPTYLDEFASFACLEFADLISKARSAGLALHFSHQSIGDLAEVSKGFLNQITDNSATKIIMRINDPDSAEFFARSFGTRMIQKVTQRVTNVEDVELAELVGEGSQREAHQFRASPDLFKTLPTGAGAVLVAHGHEAPHGASTVFAIKFQRGSAARLPVVSQ